MSSKHDTDPPPPDSNPGYCPLEPPLPGVLAARLNEILMSYGPVPISQKRTDGDLTIAERQARALKLIAEARDLLLGF